MIPHGVMESQTRLPGTSLSAVGYRCMVPAMSGLLRFARPCFVALLTAALMLGANGLVGAIHSVHHLPAPAANRSLDARGHGHGEQVPAPAGAPDQTCPIAAAALHLAASGVEAPAVLDPLPIDAELVAPGAQDALRAAWREPGSGRAPPFLRPLPS
jgi:hypothetical protein